MSDPQRLLTEGSDFEKELLGSWQSEKPSAEARARVLAMAGLGVAATVATTGAAAKTGAVLGGSIAPKAATVASVGAVKWLAIGAVTLAATAGTVALVAPSARAPKPALLAAKAAAPLATAIRAPEPKTEPQPAPDLAPGPDGVAPAPPAPHVAAIPHAATKAAPAPTTLHDEVAALDRARRALEDGKSDDAQRLVRDYQKRFKGGALSEEAEVLRIQALAARGDTAAAKAAAARFLAAHPSSPHAAVVRAATSDGAPSPR